MEYSTGITGQGPAPKARGGMPWMGQAMEFDGDPIGFLRRNYANHGSLFRMKLAGREYTVLAGTEANRFILKHEQEFFTGEGIWDVFPDTFGASHDCLMSNVEGARHKELRGMMRRGMAKGTLAERLPSVTGRFDDWMAEQSGASMALDANQMFKDIIYRQLARFLTGDDGIGYQIAYQTMIDYLIKCLTLPFLTKLPHPPKVRKAMAMLDEHGAKLRPMLDNQQGMDRTLLADIIHAAEDGMIKKSDLRYLQVVPFFAGLDTVAHSLAFVLYGILSNPDGYQQIQAEVDQHFDPDNIDLAMLGKLDTTRMAAMEALRMWPVTPIQIRKVKQDCTIDGQVLRKDEYVIYGFSVAHYDPQIYKDPDSYDIQRFSKERKEHAGAGVYVPYGIGKHICLGAGSSDVMLVLNIALLMKNFDIRFHKDRYDLKVTMFPVHYPKKMKIDLTRRNGTA